MTSRWTVIPHQSRNTSNVTDSHWPPQLENVLSWQHLPLTIGHRGYKYSKRLLKNFQYHDISYFYLFQSNKYNIILYYIYPIIIIKLVRLNNDNKYLHNWVCIDKNMDMRNYGVYKWYSILLYSQLSVVTKMLLNLIYCI